MASKIDIVIEYLKKNEGKRYTPREIAEWYYKTYPEKCLEMRRKARGGRLNEDKDLKEQVRSSISANSDSMVKKEPRIVVTTDRPRKFYFAGISDEDETKEQQSSNKVAGKNPQRHYFTTKPKVNSTLKGEERFYPVLSKFLETENVRSKRINERRSTSKKKGASEWLHPDLVGIEDLSKGWDDKIKECVKDSGAKARLWSSEVKEKIDIGNVRESFFQAVSNSSWANLGYLAAGELAISAKPVLRVLSSLHGIGFILLNEEEPRKSQIVIPARERPQVDWNAADQLAKINPDFREYIKLITSFFKGGDLNIEGAWGYKV